MNKKSMPGYKDGGETKVIKESRKALIDAMDEIRKRTTGSAAVMAPREKRAGGPGYEKYKKEAEAFLSKQLRNISGAAISKREMNEMKKISKFKDGGAAKSKSSGLYGRKKGR